MRIFVCDAIGKLVHIRFAKKNRSCGGKTSGNIAVLLWNEICENFGSGSSADTACVKIVLQGNGNAEKRIADVCPASTRSANEFALGQARLLSRAAGKHGEKCIDRRIQARDTLERGIHQIYRRDFFAAEQS